MAGFYVNMIRRIDNRKYVNCYPSSKTVAQLPQSSLYASIKNPSKYAVYGQLKSIFGKQSFSVVSKIPPTIIEEYMKSDEGKCLESCWKKGDETQGKNRKNKNKYEYQKGKTSKKEYYSKKRR